MKPDDKPKNIPSENEEEPKLFIMVEGKKFPKPGLETYFVDNTEIQDNINSPDKGCSCNPVTGYFCACNKVRKEKPTCQCVGYESCSCDSHRTEKTCQCVGYESCSCDSHRTEQRTTGCRCAPVH